MELGINPTITKKKKKTEARPFYLKYFFILIFVVVIIILAPGYLILLGPERDIYAVDKTAITEAEADLRLSIKKLIEYKQINASYATISQGEAAKVEEIIPIGIDKPSLYVNVESIASFVGITLEDISITEGLVSSKQKKGRKGDEVKSDKFQGILDQGKVSVVFSDVSYANLKTTLSAFEENLRLFDVDSYSYNSSDSTLNVDLITYYLK